jgi:hypothetical protein
MFVQKKKILTTIISANIGCWSKSERGGLDRGKGRSNVVDSCGQWVGLGGFEPINTIHLNPQLQ